MEKKKKGRMGLSMMLEKIVKIFSQYYIEFAQPQWNFTSAFVACLIAVG